MKFLHKVRSKYKVEATYSMVFWADCAPKNWLAGEKLVFAEKDKLPQEGVKPQWFENEVVKPSALLNWAEAEVVSSGDNIITVKSHHTGLEACFEGESIISDIKWLEDPMKLLADALAYSDPFYRKGSHPTLPVVTVLYAGVKVDETVNAFADPVKDIRPPQIMPTLGGIYCRFASADQFTPGMQQKLQSQGVKWATTYPSKG